MMKGGTGYQYASDLYLRLLGGVYLIAFYSLSSQVHGLIGESGVLPAGLFFERAADVLGASRFIELPSIFWLSAGDRALGLACYTGMFFSVLLIIGLVPIVTSLCLWMLYLSLAVAGQTFLAFQWDNLLLEAGLLGVLLAPGAWRLHLRANPRVPRLVILLLHILIFKLMFMSGYVKLASGDPAWRDLSALSYHFWSQPLPVWVAWYVDQAPVFLLKGAVLFMFFVELIAPFFIFAGRYGRYAAFVLFVALQFGILATGNYGFFNILTIVLCVPLLDDRVFTKHRVDEGNEPPAWLARTLRVIRSVAAVGILVVTALLFLVMFKPDAAAKPPASRILGAVMPFRSVNSYGLFSVMTKARNEIVVEGSVDGVNWRAYEFKYKPGDVYRTPLFAVPHMPRLDWQMWFAALGTYERNPWLINMMARILEGERDVLDLLAINPFNGEEPQYIRAVLYGYSFASREQNRDHFLWWNRELKGLYCPVLSNRP